MLESQLNCDEMAGSIDNLFQTRLGVPYIRMSLIPGSSTTLLHSSTQNRSLWFLAYLSHS